MDTGEQMEIWERERADYKNMIIAFHRFTIHKKSGAWVQGAFHCWKATTKTTPEEGPLLAAEPLLCTFRCIITRMTYQRAGGGI